MPVSRNGAKAMLSRLLRAETAGGASTGKKDTPNARERSVSKANEKRL